LPATTKFAKRLGLESGVVARQIVGEQLAVLKHRVDGIAEEAGIGADAAHRLEILGTVRAQPDAARRDIR